MPISCQLRSEIINILNIEEDRLGKEIEKTHTREDMADACEDFPSVTEIRQERMLLQRQIDTIKGYWNLLQAESCVD